MSALQIKGHAAEVPCLKQERRDFDPRLSHRYFLNFSNPSNHTRPWGLLKFQQKLVPENFSKGKTRPVCKADSLTAIFKPSVQTMRDPHHLTNIKASAA